MSQIMSVHTNWLQGGWCPLGGNWLSDGIYVYLCRKNDDNEVYVLKQKKMNRKNSSTFYFEEQCLFNFFFISH
jgi:hypothetical protein